MGKAVLWKTTFHTSSKMNTENKREKIHAENVFAKPCNQNYALFLNTTLTQPPDPFSQYFILVSAKTQIRGSLGA